MILKQANAQYSAHPQTHISCENTVAICRKNCRSVNHVTSFGEMTSLVAFFPCYHSKRKLAGRLMLVTEKSVPVRSEGEYQEPCTGITRREQKEHNSLS